MAVKKGNGSVTSQLNAGLKALQSNGTYAKLSKQYFGQDIRCK